MSDLSHHRHSGLFGDLARALDLGEFQLWFQPKVRLSDHMVTGVEGLARWHHPERGVLTPGNFLPALRATTLINTFTNQMIEQAVSFAGEANHSGLELEVAVNLGPRSFLVPGLADYIRHLLNAHDVRPRQLVVEITEEDLLDESPAATGAFDALGRLGVQLSIDDFGTGYSSLARLRRLPVDEVKIDQEFVGALGTAHEDTVIVRTIIELARLLDHVTVAEGIETIEQLDILRRLGCIHGQGWLFAKPMQRGVALEQLNRDPRLAPTNDAGTLVASTHAIPIHAFAANGQWGREGIRLDAGSSQLNNALITDRQQLDLINAVLDIVPCGAFIKDAQARFVQANAEARATMGVDSIDDLVGRTDFDVHDFEDAVRYQADDLHVLTSGKPIIDRVQRRKRADGTSELTRVSKIPVRNSAGEIIGLAGFTTELL